MKEQSSPLGQHIAAMTAVELSGVHVELEGQQNSNGKPVPHWTSPGTLPHVFVSKVVISWADVEEMTAVRKRRRDIRESLGGPMERPIVTDEGEGEEARLINSAMYMERLEDSSGKAVQSNNGMKERLDLERKQKHRWCRETNSRDEIEGNQT
jgi:hypothetical protein